jgi:site-specific DNA recombinase
MTKASKGSQRKQMPPDSEPQAVIYARVSSTVQGDNYSLPTQIEGCRAYADAHGYSVAAVITDQHTGILLQRPGITQLLEQVKGGGVQIVLVYDLDRFTRDPDHLAVLEYEIEEAGARVEYVLGNFADTPEGKLSKAIKVSIAEYENRQRSERIMRGRRGRATAGYVMPVGKRAPYGYRYVKTGNHTGCFEVEENEAETVRALFQWVDGGSTVHQAVTRLNAAAVPASAGGMWRPSAVHNILRNILYTGVRYQNRQRRTVWGSKKSSTVLRPEEEWIAVQAPALVETALWQRVQVQLDAAARKRPRVRAYLLTGHIRCACGRIWEGSSRSETLQYYRCPSIKEARWRAPCAMAGNIRADVLEAAVWDAVERLLLDPQMAEAEVRRQGAQKETARRTSGEQQQALVVQARRLERQTQMLVTRVLAGEMTSAAAAAQKQELDAQLALIRQQQESIAAQQARDGGAAALRDLATLLKELRAGLADLSFDGRRRLFALLELRLDVISISPAGSEVRMTTVLSPAPLSLTLPPGRRTRQLTKSQEDRARA